MLIVHERVCKRHPNLSEQDVLDAWNNALRSLQRVDKDPNEYVALGFDRSGRAIEMVAKRSERGNWLIFHAMTPPSAKTLKELGLKGGPHNDKR